MKTPVQRLTATWKAAKKEREWIDEHTGGDKPTREKKCVSAFLLFLYFFVSCYCAVAVVVVVAAAVC